MFRLPLHIGSLVFGPAAVGLGLAPFMQTSAAFFWVATVAALMAAVSLICWRMELPATRLLTGIGIALLTLLAGLLLGEARLAAIDAGAFDAEVGKPVHVSGYLDSPPRDGGHDIRLHLSGPEGRIVAIGDRSQLPGVPLPVGTGLRVEGRVEAPPQYLRELTRRLGIRQIVRAERIAIDSPRGGVLGLLDSIRERALSGLGAGMPPREAALAAGFVFGQDGAIDAVTEENFRRSGLAHLVAASGQNVMLLILLGTAPLAVAGLHLRQRMPILIALVLIYLPLTGAGPSVQRAAVMGIVMLAMIWLGGVGPRLLALLVAATLTLLADPRASGDAGWQLSFAATAGIMLLAQDLRWLLLKSNQVSVSASAAGGSRARSRSSYRSGPVHPSPLRRLLADGIAVTVAATLATAPLIAHHFGSLPVASLSANLLALPAVAPTMWLGMVSGIAAQLPGLPTEAVNWVNAFLIAYIAEIAASVSALPGGVASVELRPGWLVALVEVALLASVWIFLRRLRRASDGRRGSSRVGVRWAAVTLIVLGLALLIPIAGLLAPNALLSTSRPPADGLRITALDVGQGDAILIQLAGRSLLVDTGPPQAGIVRDLDRFGVKRLDAVFITHADLDHIGGLADVAGRFEVMRLFFGDPPPRISRGSSPFGSDVQALGSGPIPGLASRHRSPLAAGDRVRFGELTLEVLWPPRLDRPPTYVDDRNERSLVLLLRWRGFKALLTGDAEAEATSYPIPDVDLLKVAHHGSADAGLAAMLDAASPEVALISVGEDNGYGHPAPATLATLEGESVSIHRTDQEGDLVIELEAGHR